MLLFFSFGEEKVMIVFMNTAALTVYLEPGFPGDSAVRARGAVTQ